MKNLLFLKLGLAALLVSLTIISCSKIEIEAVEDVKDPVRSVQVPTKSTAISTTTFDFQVGQEYVYISKAPADYGDGNVSFKLTFVLAEDGVTLDVTQEEITSTAEHTGTSVTLIEGSYELNGDEVDFTNDIDGQFVFFDGNDIEAIAAGGDTKYRCSCYSGAGTCDTKVAYNTQTGELVHTCKNTGCGEVAASLSPQAYCKKETVKNGFVSTASVLVSSDYNVQLTIL